MNLFLLATRRRNDANTRRIPAYESCRSHRRGSASMVNHRSKEQKGLICWKCTASRRNVERKRLARSLGRLRRSRAVRSGVDKVSNTDNRRPDIFLRFLNLKYVHSQIHWYRGESLIGVIDKVNYRVCAITPTRHYITPHLVTHVKEIMASYSNYFTRLKAELARFAWASWPFLLSPRPNEPLFRAPQARPPESPQP